MHFTDECNWPARVARHNLVYLTPANDPMQGWPLGNGEIGALLWTDACHLYMAVNRTDLWDDARFTRFHNWAHEEEEFSTALRHGGRVIWEFDLPVFDPIYLRDFRAELDLTTATLRLDCRSVFGELQMEVFVAEKSDAVRVKFKRAWNEGSGVRMRVEHYGSRTFSHWYAQIRNTPEAGLSGTEATVIDGGMVVTHAVSDGTFALAAVDSDARAFRRINRFSAEEELALTGESEAVVVLTPPAFPDADAARSAGLDALVAEAALPWAERHAQTAQAWKRFWSASHLACGDDFLDQLWHLQQYYANASQRGRYPGRFIGGVWFWMRDFQAWNFYFHWNQQMIYWPMYACGHPEVCESYLNWRWAGLPAAQEAARELFQLPGAWVSDVCDRRGYPSEHEARNHTPAAQIAMDFYRHWQYTRDAKFLRERAYPYMLEAARFLTGCLERTADGVYRPKAASAYEGWIPVNEVVTELSALRSLLPALLEAEDILGVEAPERQHFLDVLEHLAPFAFGEDLDQFSDADGNCGVGAFRGAPWNGRQRLAAGYLAATGEKTYCTFPGRKTASPPKLPHLTAMMLENGLPTVEGSFYDITSHEGLFPHAELSVVFPAGLVGEGDRGSAMYDAAVNTARIEALEGGFLAWDPEPVMLARLGLGTETYRFLTDFVTYWQNHENGWFTDSLLTKEALLPRLKNQVYDIEKGPVENIWACSDRRPFSAWPFRHMGMEGMGVLGTTLNESLLQSHDGVIRVAPAFPADREGSFTLWAVGGHRVSARIRHGHVDWIVVTTGPEGRAAVANPWQDALVNGVSDRTPTLQLAGPAGMNWILTDAAQPVKPEIELAVAAPEPHTHAGLIARLGTERTF